MKTRKVKKKEAAKKTTGGRLKKMLDSKIRLYGKALKSIGKKLQQTYSRIYSHSKLAY